jgi:hypothetical protein
MTARSRRTNAQASSGAPTSSTSGSASPPSASTVGRSTQSTASPSSPAPARSSWAPRSWWSCGRRGTSHQVAANAATPTGTLTRKIQRQPVASPIAWMISPPSTGPAAAEMETVSPNSPNALARSAPVNSCWMRPEFCGVSSPAAAPWTSRATTTSSAVGASPTAALATTNPTRPTSIIVRRP